jgi:hypothetical protein
MRLVRTDVVSPTRSDKTSMADPDSTSRRCIPLPVPRVLSNSPRVACGLPNLRPATEVTVARSPLA